jgi:hypothetical protein
MAHRTDSPFANRDTGTRIWQGAALANRNARLPIPALSECYSMLSDYLPCGACQYYAGRQPHSQVTQHSSPQKARAP